MSETFLVLLGAGSACLLAALWNAFYHSRPNHFRLELRRLAMVKARALYEAEAAALQAYTQVQTRAREEMELEDMARRESE